MVCRQLPVCLSVSCLSRSVSNKLPGLQKAALSVRPRYDLSRQRSTHGFSRGSGSLVRFPGTLPVHLMSSDSAGGDKTSITTNTTDYPIFRTTDGDEIRYNDNPATIPGVMYEIQLCLKRTGTYLMLLKHRAVELSSGGLAVDSADAIPFIEGTLPGAKEYSFEDPCPSTQARYHEFNVSALSATPRRATVTPSKSTVPKEQSKNCIASEHKVTLQLRQFKCAALHTALTTVMKHRAAA